MTWNRVFFIYTNQNLELNYIKFTIFLIKNQSKNRLAAKHPDSFHTKYKVRLAAELLKAAE